MTTTTHQAPETSTAGPQPGVGKVGGEDFTTGEGLRSLLTRLDEAGDGAWRDDPQAAALMVYAAQKYTPLARRHGLDVWEAASAAFDAMRTPAVRRAGDPWAVVTRAVQVTCIAEERANGLLCSTHQARRAKYSRFHDAERFSDREDNPLTDFHPALQHHNDEDEVGDRGETAVAIRAVREAIRLLTALGWAEEVTQAGVELVAERLADAGSRASAFEALRRDHQARAWLDLTQRSWMALLRFVLGNPDPAYAATPAGRGVLLRLASGEPATLVLRDDDLVLATYLARPPEIGTGGRDG